MYFSNLSDRLTPITFVGFTPLSLEIIMKQIDIDCPAALSDSVPRILLVTASKG